MLITMTAIWGAGLALYLTHRSVLCLAHLGTRLLQHQRPPRPRRRSLDTRMWRNRQEVAVRLQPPRRNGGSLSHSLRGERS